jgi:hypothetical protein
MIRPTDVDTALEALTEAGMRPERPPEDWLVKAWDGDTLVDLIYCPKGLPVNDDLIERGEELSVLGMEMRVMALEDVLATKLLAIGEHNLDYESCLQIARSLREQIAWDDVRARTAESPYARGFFTIVEGLGIVEPGPQAEAAKPGQADQPKVRIRAV